MIDKIRERQRKQRQFLFHLYETVDGQQRKVVNMWDLGDELGFSEDETRQVVAYLRGEYLLERLYQGGGISISHAGIAKVQNSYEEPETNGAVGYKNGLEAELRAVKLTLEELKGEYEKGAIDAGRYFRLKKEYETSRAELEQRLDDLPREEGG
jgi:hypothetical protein